MDINTVLMMISDKIPSNSLPLVQDKLKNASEDKINSLAILPFKSHIIGLILGLFLGAFGIDRFYKGDIGLGIAKLITWLVGVVTIWIYRWFNFIRFMDMVHCGLVFSMERHQKRQSQ